MNKMCDYPNCISPKKENSNLCFRHTMDVVRSAKYKETQRDQLLRSIKDPLFEKHPTSIQVQILKRAIIEILEN